MATALITGASSGIGLEIARILARDHDVVLAARRADKLEALAADLGSARVVAVDLADPAGPRKLVAEVPTVDVLVNNAGFADWGPFADAAEAKLDEMIELNVGALTRLARVPPGDDRARPGSRAQRRVDRRVPTRTADGRVLRDEGVRVVVERSARRGDPRHRRHGHCAVSGPDREWVPSRAAMEDSRLVKGRKLPSAASVAAYGVKAMNRGDVVAVPGVMNKVMAASVRVSPRPVIRRLVHRMQDATRAVPAGSSDACRSGVDRTTQVGDRPSAGSDLYGA